MVQFLILLGGIVILVKKQVHVTKTRLIAGRDARNLGLFYVISSLILIFIPLDILLRVEPWIDTLFVLYLILFFGVTAYFIKKAKRV